MMKAQSRPSDSSLVFECDFDEPPEKVWRALTEPRLLEAWLATKTERRQPPPAEYEILSAEPHRLLRYRWRDRWLDRCPDRESDVGDAAEREVHSVVTVELAPRREGGTHLRLTHGDFRTVSAAPSVTAARVRPITTARLGRARRTATVSLAGHYFTRRAA